MLICDLHVEAESLELVQDVIRFGLQKEDFLLLKSYLKIIRGQICVTTIVI